jgi:hypothetical protein
MESSTSIGDGEVGGKFEGLGRNESFDASLFEWLCRNRLVELPVPCICVIHRLKWDKLGWIWWQVRSVPFLVTFGIITVDKLIWCALQDGPHLPGACVCIPKFVDDAMLGIQPNCTSSKDDVANRVGVRIRAARVNKLTMVRALFLHQKLCDLTTCRQACRQFFWIWHNSAGQGSELPVQSAGEVDRKRKLLAEGNQTARYIRAGHRARVPCIQQEQDGLQCHSDGIAFVAHDLRPLVR